MKATGIVRRIDDLGRLVVPREIRHALGIEEGTPFEIFTDDKGSIIFTPYRPMQEETIAADLESLAYFYEGNGDYAHAKEIRKIKSDLLKSVKD
jgi:transcriptional pleiotropic regulator of transition state genes